MTDVNEQFALQRAGQLDAAENKAAWAEGEVAAGRLRNLGNGRFSVTEGYDRGEIITINSKGELLAQHGLDMTTGKAAIYSRSPMWHQLAEPIPEGVSDIDTVLDLAGLNYRVEKRPVIYRNPVTGLMEPQEGAFHTHRLDTGKALGIVGNVFEPLQNREGFEFLEALVGKFGVIWESAGALRDGARTFVAMRLPEAIVIDRGGVADEIIPFVVALNSHDGTGKFECIVTPWRPICGNTERFAVRDAVVRWGARHTMDVRNKVSEAQYTLAKTVRYFEQFAAEEELLAQQEFKQAELEKLVNEVWKEIDEDSSQRAITMRKKLLATLEPMHAANVATLGETAYAAERTITEWADWKRNVSPRSESLRGDNLAARATAVLEDTAGDFKSRAHRQLMLRVNR